MCFGKLTNFFYKFLIMLVYFKNKHGEIVGINVEPKQTTEELVQNIEDLRSIKRVRINKFHSVADLGLLQHPRWSSL